MVHLSLIQRHLGFNNNNKYIFIKHSLSSEEIPYCTDVETVLMVTKLGREALRPLLTFQIPNCTKPCRTTKYRLSQNTYGKAYSPQIDNFFYLAVASTDIIVEEEIRIFDANSIVASIGGSLGLFIGFSFLQCLGELFNKCFEFCNKQN
jgi:hypothetical protein